MKKYVNGEYVEMTSEEIEELQEQGKEAIYQEHIRPHTVDECIVTLAKSLVVTQTAESDDKTLGIQCMALFEPWTKGNYKAGDVRTDPKTGCPYECIQAHDSTVNTDWDITVRTLWKPWHSKSLEYALPWEAPTGAHDMYKQGEYMIYTDKNIYKCIQDTNFSPTDYPQAWEKQ